MNEGASARIGSEAFNGDDLVLPFQTVQSGVMGRLVRLGPVVDAILSRHDHPEPVAQVLGQAIALAAMLGAALKFDGKFILQTKTNGPLHTLVVNYETPGQLRAYAAFDAGQVEAICHTRTEPASTTPANTDPVSTDPVSTDPACDAPTQASLQASLLGNGYLAMTIDPEGDMDRHQGIVELGNENLVDAAFTYFRDSEQLPTFIRLAVARQYIAGSGNEAGSWQWRAGGLLVQHISPEGGHDVSKHHEANDQDDDQSHGQDHEHGDDQAHEQAWPMHGDTDDNWTRVRILAETVEDHELLDPTLPPDRLLYRLFHEEGVRAHPPLALYDHCPCSRDRIKAMLAQYGSEEFDDLLDYDGNISVTCEFCAENYVFNPDELASIG